MNKSDAEVTLRSFGRRFREVLNGPAEDPAWDRIVRQPDTVGMSALGYALLATESLTALGTTLNKLSSEAAPTIELTDHREAPFDVTVSDVTSALAAASAEAADALDARSNDDLDRPVVLESKSVQASIAVQRVIDHCVHGLKGAQAALETTT